MTFVDNEGVLFTAGEALPLVVFLDFAGWLLLSAPRGGVPELPAPRMVTSVNRKLLFLTAAEPLPPVVFPVSSGWLILSAPRVYMPEMLASY